MNFATLMVGRNVTINNTAYIILKSNNNSNESVSFYNYKTKKYIRHYMNTIIESDCSLNPNQFIDDSSFIPEFTEMGFCFHCVNSGLTKKYICKSEDNRLLIDDKISPLYINDFSNNIMPSYNEIIIENLIIKNTEINKDLNDIKTKYRLDISCGKLRSISDKIRKNNRVVFIGTGKLGENTQYAFMKFCDIIKERCLDIETKYFARNQIEKDYFDNLGYPCEIWTSLVYENIEYALLSKVSVFSTHTIADNYSNSVLVSALSGSCKIQLWHGFLAKMVGSSTLKNRQDLVRISNMLEDTCVDIVTVALISDEITTMYKQCFPGAMIVATGDARTDNLFVEAGINYNNDDNRSNNIYRVLITPTYRESKKAAIDYINNLANILKLLIHKNIRYAIKFHPIYFSRFNENEKEEMLKQFSELEVCIINEREDSYLVMPDYDALITDYSSIRFDYMITGRAVFLYRPDFKEYSKLRRINPIKEFDSIDNISYNLSNDNANTFFKNLLNDPLRDKRYKCLNSIGLKRDGMSSFRVSELILSKLK